MAIRRAPPHADSPGHPGAIGFFTAGRAWPRLACSGGSHRAAATPPLPYHTTMRIVTGALRGRVVPSSRVLQSIRLTSSRLKEAVFSMVGDDLTGLLFLDLCAGSGQIGLEAASRGAQVWINEPDERRWLQIAGLVRQWQVGNVQLCRDKGQVLIERLQTAGPHFDLTYIDPPYDATRHGRPLSAELLEQLGATAVVAPGGFVLVQHQAELRLVDTAGGLTVVRRREYGATTLSVYARS